ncbi:membrane bound O-acyl transferase family-domain-containing protein [Xylogone sp. PMI_703]|nr:membrane bound O-acyl transferase family-domain-containing protein [Xylogone sp. PMI_703]
MTFNMHTDLWDGRVYFVLAILSTPILLSLPPSSVIRRALYYLPLLLLFYAYNAPLGSGTPDSPSTGAYQFGILLASWTMRILDRMYLNDPETAFLRIDDEKPQSPLKYSPLEKLGWALELMFVTRGVGWNWQISQIPPQKALSRGSFLFKKAREAVVTIGILCMIKVASASLLRLAEGVSEANMLTTLLLHPAFLHAFMYASWAFVVFSSLNLAENIMALIFVGFRITKRWSHPEMWPSVFGSIKESYGIRRSWGLFWHQNMRRICQSPANFVLQNIPLFEKPKSRAVVLARRYMRLMLIFFFSGIIHAGGSIYMSQHQANVTDGGNIIGFVYQGLALMGEDALLWLLGVDDTKSASLIRRIIGYSFVHGYAAYATPTLKVIPLARDHGLQAPGSPYMVGVKMVGVGAQGVLKNPFATMVGSFNV